MAEDSQRIIVAALRTITHARITCTNTIAELEVIDGLTDDWNMDNALLSKYSLEIHLQAEFSAKEASTILENLTAIMTNRTMSILEEWLCMELEVRRENAVLAVKEIVNVLDTLEEVVGSEELGLTEIKRRAELILGKLDKLKDTLLQLAVHWKAAVETRTVKPVEKNDGVFSPRSVPGT